MQCIEQRIFNTSAFDAATDNRELKIALTDMAKAMYMARILNAVARAAPHVRLRSVALAQVQQQRALSEGQVDLALGYLPDLLASEFVRRKIAQPVYVCICSASNRELIEDFSLRKYYEARHVVIDSSSRSQGLLEEYLHMRGIHRNVALATPHAMSLLEIIAGTDLIASIPDSLAQFYADLRRLKRMPLPFRSPVLENHMHWSKSVHNNPANRWLRATVTQALAVAAG